MPPSYSCDVDGDLPFIDEHDVLVAAPALDVWRVLARQFALPRLGGAGAYAHLVAAQPRRAFGEPLTEGSTLPGFEVAQAVPGEHALLTGRHRFSRYALLLTLVEQPGGTLLSARTHAEFPGPHGFVYRRLVIGSGIHGILVARQLRAVRDQAEAQSVPP